VAFASQAFQIERQAFTLKHREGSESNHVVLTWRLKSWQCQ
jgi:hypothetical protein